MFTLPDGEKGARNVCVALRPYDSASGVIVGGLRSADAVFQILWAASDKSFNISKLVVDLTVVHLSVEIARVGKRNTLYLPKGIAAELALEPGDMVELRVEGSSLRVNPIRDPLKLAIGGSKFAKIMPEEIEETSIAEQRKRNGSSA
jgi:antitoxin MazE